MYLGDNLTEQSGKAGAMKTDLLLVLLVDGIHGILDSDALHAPCGDMQAQREVQVNLLDWWLGQVQLENIPVFDSIW